MTNKIIIQDWKKTKKKIDILIQLLKWDSNPLHDQNSTTHNLINYLKSPQSMSEVQ